MTTLYHSIPYRENSTRLFESLADKPWSVFLDSGQISGAQGRYDIIAADPTLTLVSKPPPSTTGIHENQNDRDIIQLSSRDVQWLSDVDPLILIREALGEPIEIPEDIPFAGGAIGYFSYDFGRRWQGVDSRHFCSGALPDLAIGIYDWALVVDHQKRSSHLVSSGRDPQTLSRWDDLVELFSTPPDVSPREPFHLYSDLQSTTTWEQYARDLRKIGRYIYDGDCYQVNYAQRFSAACKGDLWLAYQEFRIDNSGPFSAYINHPAGQILSNSPERFIRLNRGTVEAKPIKGTVQRSANSEEDKRLACKLLGSEKDRAENLMIVDLLRNDLGKVCEVGSIDVSELFELQSYATVHHLVSTVIGRLPKEQDALDLLFATLPGGSITGAPKHRAMEIIDEIEPSPRGLYCGAIGYIGFDGSMDTNIAIRTLIHQHGDIHISAGGGIVADSDSESEYQETYHKIDRFLSFLSKSKISQ
ncbi:MAG: aminodeoxychorismate synthase component I [Gammaproteobacteria bacterium]|nr:aminodeoxychorismate synthase component I [Gammaproteobacteria bacterium]